MIDNLSIINLLSNYQLYNLYTFQLMPTDNCSTTHQSSKNTRLSLSLSGRVYFSILTSCFMFYSDKDFSIATAYASPNAIFRTCLWWSFASSYYRKDPSKLFSCDFSVCSTDRLRVCY